MVLLFITALPNSPLKWPNKTCCKLFSADALYQYFSSVDAMVFETLFPDGANRTSPVELVNGTTRDAVAVNFPMFSSVAFSS